MRNCLDSEVTVEVDGQNQYYHINHSEVEKVSVVFGTTEAPLGDDKSSLIGLGRQGSFLRWPQICRQKTSAQARHLGLDCSDDIALGKPGGVSRQDGLRHAHKQDE